MEAIDRARRISAAMVSLRWLPLLLVMLFALPVLGLTKEGGDGIVLGRGAAFRVTAPSGWIFDNESCRPDQIPAVIYPLGGKLWYENDATVIYNFSYDRAEYNVLADEFAKPTSKDTRQEIPALTTRDGREARLLDLRRGNSLLRVAYIETPQVVSRIVLLAPDQATFDKAVPAFEKVVRSFRLLDADSGEYMAVSGANAILRMTAEAQDQIVPPEGWTQESGQPGVKIYQRTDGKTYGIISAFAAKPSDGDPQADYEAAWRELAQTAFQTGAAPVPKSSIHQDGWQIRIGETRVEGGQSSSVIVAVFSGYGKYTSILICFNDSSFRSEIEGFLANSVHPSGSFRSGGWTFRDSRSRQFLNGELVNLGEHGYATRSYFFEKDTYRLEGVIQLDSHRSVRLDERGTYSVRGNKLSLNGRGGTQREFRGDREISSRVLPLWNRTYTFKQLEVPEAVHGQYLVLWGVKENDIDGGYSGFISDAFVYVYGYH